MKPLTAIFLVVTLLTLSVLFGCESKPGETIANPRQYLIEKLIETELNVWPFRNNDMAFIESIVDEQLKEFSGEIPTDSEKLNQLARFRFANAYKAASIGTEAGRALILEKVRQRFENPPMKTYGSKPAVALLDYHYQSPGKRWKSAGHRS